MADAIETPWSDLKVCFPVEVNTESLWRDIGRFLPPGWEMVETAINGASGYVAIFRVDDNLPTVEDGKRVLAAIDSVDRHCEAPLEVEKLQPGMYCDIQGDMYADDAGILPEAEFAYAVVIEVRVNPPGERPGTVVVEFDQCSIAFPIGHELTTIKEPL